MLITYYATTISFIAAVWAVPVEVSHSPSIESSLDSSTCSLQIPASSNSGLHARKTDAFILTKQRPVPYDAVPHDDPLSPPRRPPSPVNIGHSTITISLLSAAEYADMHPDVIIHDEPCDTSQQSIVEDKIKTLLHAAILTSDRLVGVRFPAPVAYVFQGNCQAQWLPDYTSFRFRVDNGLGTGECEQEWCVGELLLRTGHGSLSSPNHQRFYRTMNNTDIEQVNGLFNSFRHGH